MDVIFLALMGSAAVAVLAAMRRIGKDRKKRQEAKVKWQAFLDQENTKKP